MKLLKLLARVLPHSWFVALLSSRVCRGIRIRLISRSFEFKFPSICYRLQYSVIDAFGLTFSYSEIQHIFKMSYLDAVNKYCACFDRNSHFGWWALNDSNREKYHNSLFFKQ
jgi:hypothetical protein